MAETVRRTRTFLGRHEAPCRTAIKKLVEKFELLGQVSDVKNKTRARRSRTVLKKTQVCPFKLGIPQMSLHRILHKYLSL